VIKEKSVTKRTLTFIFLILMVLFAYALDLKKSEDYYLSYFESSSSFGSYVRELIKNDLPIYRFLKIHMVGSSEKTETTKKTGDYLLSIKPFDGTNSDEERLARAIYLTYWEAKLNHRKMDVEIVKNSPIFNEFFSEYQFRVSDAFRNYAQDLVAYLFGLDVPGLPSELVPEEIKNLKKNLINNYSYEPVYNGEEKEAISILLSKSEVVKGLQEIIIDAQKSTNDFEPETLIMRTSATVFRSAFSYIAGLKNEIAQKFVDITPKEKSFAWVRWLVYLVLFAVGYFVLKNMSLVFALFLASETVYIGSFMDIQSLVDGKIYGIVFAIAVIFSVIYFFTRKKYLYSLISLLTIIALFLPSFGTPDLVMKNSFSNSPFYSALVDDIINDQLGKLKINAKDYNTLTNESIQAFSNLITELEEDGNLPEECFEPEKFDKRIEYVSNILSKHKDKKKEIDDFVYFEKSRMKKVEKIKLSTQKLLVKMASVSSENFKNDLISFVNSNFSENTAKEFSEKINSTKEISVVSLPGYKIQNYLAATILLALSLFLVALNFKEAFIPLIGSIAVSVLSLLKNQILFVQVGVPSITIYISWTIPYVLILSLVFGFIWFNSTNTFRRREKV